MPTQKYRNGERIWYLKCEQGNTRNETSSGVKRYFVKFNCFFQLDNFSLTLGYRMDVSGVQSASGMRDFSHFLKRSNWSPPNQCVLRVVVLKVKQRSFEAVHLPSANAEL